MAGVAIEEVIAGLVVVPVGYGLGAWMGTLLGLTLGRDAEHRADVRDWCGTFGGAIALGFWLADVIPY